MSNIEKDIEKLESIVKVHNDFLKGVKKETINEREIKAIENILAERKQDKKRIKELIEQVKMLDEAYTGVIKESKKWFDIAHNNIPKEELKYILQKYKYTPADDIDINVRFYKELEKLLKTKKTMKDVTNKYMDMIEDFKCDFVLTEDINLLEELSFNLRHNKTKIYELEGE